MNTKSLRVIMIEDSPGDATLLQRMFQKVFNAPSCLACYPTLAKGRAAIAADPPDVILIDMNLPDSDAEQTLAVIAEIAMRLPVIVTTGIESRTLVNQVLAAGAQDYLVKGDFNEVLLQRTLRYAIQRFRLVRDLRSALTRIRELSELLPACPCCRQIRDDRRDDQPAAKQWVDLETYVTSHEDVQVTHGICPSCLEREISALRNQKKPDA